MDGQRSEVLQGDIDPLIDSWFPGIGEYSVASRRTPRYNCIAWAAGDDGRWWWPSDDPDSEEYWPFGAPTSCTLETFQVVFQILGYEVDATGNLEDDYEKVAIFVDERMVPTHMSRQLQDGSWSSKLGRYVDIVHLTLDALEGSDYGRVVCVLRRRREDWN